MSYKVEKIAGPHSLGEGPHWDDLQQALFYVDATASSICRYKDGRLTVCKLDRSAVVSIVIPLKGNQDKFLATIGANLAEITWDGESATPQNIRIISTLQSEREGIRFNDGKIDPKGRLWVGTMGNYDANKGEFEEGVGSLHSVSNDGIIQRHVGGITIANGLAWSPDQTIMYYIDTPTKRVDAFDFDVDAGTIKNRRPVFDFSQLEEVPAQGGPDGMTIDTDGNLWVAVFGAAGVYNIDPRSGQLLRRIAIPSPQTTSVAFGGVNRDELYVVSANFNLPGEIQARYPDVGCTFRVTGLGVRGHPMSPAKFSV